MLNPLDMTGLTFLVTGASSGIGRAVAVLLSQLGARLVLVARNVQRLQETRGCLAGHGHVVEPHDLSQCEGIPAWLQAVVATHGPLDGIVHSAGRHLASPLKVMEADAVEVLFRINVHACFWLAKGFRHPAVHRLGGVIVFLSSVAGLVGGPAFSAYCASKGAVIGLTRSLAMELVRERIRVNCIAPGTVSRMAGSEDWLTEQTYASMQSEHPLGMGEPADVACAAAFLLSPAARWITGTVLVVDGGYTAH